MVRASSESIPEGALTTTAESAASDRTRASGGKESEFLVLPSCGHRPARRRRCNSTRPKTLLPVLEHPTWRQGSPVRPPAPVGVGFGLELRLGSAIRLSPPVGVMGRPPAVPHLCWISVWSGDVLGGPGYRCRGPESSASIGVRTYVRTGRPSLPDGVVLVERWAECGTSMGRRSPAWRAVAPGPRQPGAVRGAPGLALPGDPRVCPAPIDPSRGGASRCRGLSVLAARTDAPTVERGADQRERPAHTRLASRLHGT